MSDDTDTDASEHGIEEACYVRAPGGLDCVLVCLCGEQFTGDSWEDVGAELDAHLEEVGS